MTCRICGTDTHSPKDICNNCRHTLLHQQNPHLKDMEREAVAWLHNTRKMQIESEVTK